MCFVFIRVLHARDQGGIFPLANCLSLTYTRAFVRTDRLIRAAVAVLSRSDFPHGEEDALPRKGLP